MHRCYDEWATHDQGGVVGCTRDDVCVSLLEGPDFIDDLDDDLDEYFDAVTDQQRDERNDLRLRILDEWPEDLMTLPPLRKYTFLTRIPVWIFRGFHLYYEVDTSH